MNNTKTIISASALILCSSSAMAGELPAVPVMSDLSMIGMSLVLAGLCGRFLVRRLRKDA